MCDEIEEKLWKQRQRLLAEEVGFEEDLAFLVEYADWIKGLSDDDLLWWFREDGGDPELGAEEARLVWLESLVLDRC